MARRKKVLPSDVCQRSFVLMLYPDNAQHMRAFGRIKKKYASYFAGCWHVLRDDQGREIIEGEGKKHLHIAIRFDNKHMWHALASELGLDWSDDRGSRFLRPVGFDNPRQDWRGALVYLVHRNALEKEQYSSDCLFGAPSVVESAKKYILLEESKQVTLSDALVVCRRWIGEQDIISASAFVSWIVGTPYLKFCQNRWISAMIEDHNRLIWNKQREDYIEMISDSSLRHSAIIQKASGSDFSAQVGTAFEEIYNAELDGDWV